jgi:predicted nucleotidyltransferase
MTHPLKRNTPLETAKDILRVRYPQASVAFVGGSFNRGEETAYSDIDLVVIFEKLDHAWRESFTHGGWLVEAFVHDPETLQWFFEHDAKNAAPILASMVSEGPIIPDGHILGDELRDVAKSIIRTGPIAWDGPTILEKRYLITNLVDDLRAPRNAIEAAASIGALHEKLAEFYLRANRRWWAGDKHIPRKLEKADPELAARWNQIFVQAWQSGDTREIILLAEEILKPHGGFLFNDYRLDAPKDCRTPQMESDELAKPS